MSAAELREWMGRDPWAVAALVAAAVAVLLALGRLFGLRRRAAADARALADLAARHFLVQPCTRCHEAEMQLVSVSPNARSIGYACRYCGKKMHAPAASAEAGAARARFDRYVAVRDRLASRDPGAAEALEIVFVTPEAPLPFEQTRREPIPEAVRAEVWRRDGGRCVACGTNQRLEFDHIIPLARGGATSVRNLQLLCSRCNLRKGERI